MPALNQNESDKEDRARSGIDISCMSLLMLCYYVLTSLIVGSTEFLEQLAKLNGEGANHLTCLDPPDPKSKRKIFPASNLTQAGVGEGLPGQLIG